MTFGYDFLDRLTSVTGAYSQSFAYNQIGNITSMTISGTTSDYTYSAAHPHAVTAVGSISYAYDSNGNMTTRGSQSFTWDAENRLTGISDTIGGYSYDGDGNRVMKTENSVMTVYPNRYYEKDITNSVITTYYYLGDKLVANRQGTTLNYILQDHLGSTSATANSSGTQIAALAYYPWGGTRTSSGDLSTDKKFTSQRLDSTGLYYYGARYYDPAIGRFISADSQIQIDSSLPTGSSNLCINLAGMSNHSKVAEVPPLNPQSLNRYSYVLNNPLKYIDQQGHFAFLAAAIPILIAVGRGAAIGAISYTIVNKATGSEWSWRDFTEATAIGGLTGGLGAWGSTVKAISTAGKVLSFAAKQPEIIGALGGTIQYSADVIEGQANLNAMNAAVYSLLGASTGFVGRLVPAKYAPLENAAASVSSKLAAGIIKYAINTYSQNINSPQDSLTGVSIGNTGFSLWGFDSSGIPVVAMHDPSTYSASDWYGY